MGSGTKDSELLRKSRRLKNTGAGKKPLGGAQKMLKKHPAGVFEHFFSLQRGFTTLLIFFIAYTTKELKMPTVKTSRNQTLKPENTNVLLSLHPLGVAKTTGTP